MMYMLMTLIFFAVHSDIHCVYYILQTYLRELEIWLESLELKLNASKSAIPVFPVKGSAHISIIYKLQDIFQVESIKYIIVIYNESHNCWLHIEYVATKGVHVMYILH